MAYVKNPIGYNVRDINRALSKFVSNGPSETRIRRYIKENNLGEDYIIKDFRKKKTLLISEANLERLLTDMNIPVKVNDIVREIDGFI
ncbi:MAG: hypothetical protein AABW83_03845 [Nanoarchaeota archaeon]